MEKIAEAIYASSSLNPPMGSREIYFHEDDYCQQQLLLLADVEYLEAEMKAIDDFADAHRVEGGFGFTDMYLRKDAPTKLSTLQIKKEEFAAIVSPFLPPFDVVYTGYSTYRERCKNTLAWGLSARCAIFAAWNEQGVVEDIWTNFFERDEPSILAATNSVAALGKRYPLVYIDWAWQYGCKAADDQMFASRLRSKLASIGRS